MLEHGGRWRAAPIAHIARAVALVQRGLWLALTLLGLAALGSLDA